MFSSRKTGSASNNYLLTRSLRFRSSASAYLNRTPASAGNQQKWTWSGWVKRGAINASFQRLFSAKDAANDDADCLRFNSGETFTFFFRTTPNLSITGNLTTTQVFRDPSAWYHIIAVLDTTDATSSNRMKLYINGSQVTAFSTATYPAQNANGYINSTNLHTIGNNAASLAQNFDGYMAEVNFIDGQALTPSSFGATNAATGVWQPIKYTGTYGTNGFYLPFTDTTSTTTLGNDSSGNGNNWTTNNISLTSGATYDSMTDVPTLTSATAANYCTWNPVGIYVTTPLDGNLKISGTSAGANGTIGASSGKFYWECVYTAIGSSEGVIVGIRSTDSIATGAAENVGYYGGGTENGKKIVNGVGSAYAATWTTNDVIGVALDLDGGTVTFYKNNVSQGAISFTVGGKTWTSFNWRTGPAGTNTGTINFGQQPFSYTPPSGFVALNTFNLPTPTIGASSASQANDYFDVTTYTGTGSSQSITNSGSMQPDFVWIKGRSGATDHGLYDAVRGVQIQLESNNTNAETTETTGLTAFNSNGFTVGALAQLNTSSATYVGWQWKANGSGSTNTAGSITSTVSANTTAGFSIATYTGNGTNGATVGHGLGVAPAMMIIKTRSAVNSWVVYHQSLGNTKAIYLNLTGAADTNSSFWNNTSPTSSVLTLGTDTICNQNGTTYVAYCFAEVAGYSAFGSYTGNGSTDGPFVFTGFRPKFVLIKSSSNAATNWTIFDTSRNPSNVTNARLFPNDSSAELTESDIDLLSNGFKLRTGTNTDYNSNGATYIYAAFAESPFKFSLAR